MSAVKKQWVKVQGGDEPSESIDPVDEDDDSRLLVGAEATVFRGIADRFNQLSADRPHLQYALKEAARNMSSPCAAGWSLLTQIGVIYSGVCYNIFMAKEVGTRRRLHGIRLGGMPRVQKINVGRGHHGRTPLD